MDQSQDQTNWIKVDIQQSEFKGKAQQIGSKEESDKLNQRKNTTNWIKKEIQQIGSNKKSNKVEKGRKDPSDAAPDTVAVLPQELRRRWNDANQVDFHLLVVSYVCLFKKNIFFWGTHVYF